jgi:hypothetical protein
MFSASEFLTRPGLEGAMFDQGQSFERVPTCEIVMLWHATVDTDRAALCAAHRTVQRPTLPLRFPSATALKARVMLFV